MPKQEEYVYKLKHKFVKKPELLEEFGFNKYVDDDGEVVIARPLTLPFECGIVKTTKKLFEHFYKEATEEEKKNDFKDFCFNEDGTVSVTPKMQKEWTECQVCFYATGIGKNQLFINAPDHNQYFNKIVLDECAKHVIDDLIKNKVIYRTRVK